MISIETATELEDIKRLIAIARSSRLYVSFYGDLGLSGRYREIVSNQTKAFAISILKENDKPVSVALCFETKFKPKTFFFTIKSYRERGYASLLKKEIDKHVPDYTVHRNSEHKGNRIFMKKKLWNQMNTVITRYMNLYVQALLAEKAGREQLATILEDKLGAFRKMMYSFETEITDLEVAKYINEEISFDEFYIQWSSL